MLELIECPRHGGSFDCTPFCDLCEGNQEYDPKETEELCGCPAPKGVYFYNAHFTGNAVAGCHNCNFKSVYWECGSELIHNCNNY